MSRKPVETKPGTGTEELAESPAKSPSETTNRAELPTPIAIAFATITSYLEA